MANPFKKTPSKFANQKLKDAFKFILIAPATTVGLTSIVTLLTLFQDEQIDFRKFAIAIVCTILGTALNIIIYWIYEYKKSREIRE